MAFSQRRRSTLTRESTSSTSSIPQETISAAGGVEAFAGAVANAIIQSISTATQNLTRNSSSSDTEPTTFSNFCGSHVLIHNSSDTRRHSQPEGPLQDSSGPTTFEQAAGIRQVKRPRFEPPSLFEAVRRGRHHRSGSSTAGRSRTKTTENATSKTTLYARNIILLPPQYKSSNGEVLIPRRTKRSLLGQAGLVGKTEIASTMTELEVRREICEMFSTPMGLTSDDLKNDRFFPCIFIFTKKWSTVLLRTISQ